MDGSMLPTVVSTTPAATKLPTLKETTSMVTQEFATLIVNAFGLMAALAWSDFVKTLFAKRGALSRLPINGPFAFACLVTCVAVVVTAFLGKMKKTECTRLCAPGDK